MDGGRSRTTCLHLIATDKFPASCGEKYNISLMNTPQLPAGVI